MVWWRRGFGFNSFNGFNGFNRVLTRGAGRREVWIYHTRYKMVGDAEGGRQEEQRGEEVIIIIKTNVESGY